MKVLVAGGTGLIGQFLLDQMQADPDFREVVALTRRPKSDSRTKVKWVLADFDDVDALASAAIGADAVCCCLGTTIKKAGSQEAFRKVDHDFVVNLANAAKKADCKKFMVVSAIGSDPGSSIFYSRVKGEMESAIRGLAIERVVVFKPSMLVGPREENRVGEKLGIALGKVLAPLMVGGLKKYRPIHVKDVAASIRGASKRAEKGFFEQTFTDMVAA